MQFFVLARTHSHQALGFQDAITKQAGADGIY
jgi:hypothetical protein